MTTQLTATIKFKKAASRAKEAIVMIYDIASFSKFFNLPDVHRYVPTFINIVSDTISTIFFGGENYWYSDYEKKSYDPLLISPIHEKFLGDGGLYLWTLPKGRKKFPSNFIVELCNSLYDLKNQFQKIIEKCRTEIPIYDLPEGIRFGLAKGTVYELTREGSNDKEYIGICINLASRLQNYCSGLGFIASARMDITEPDLKEFEYIKVVATKIKGFPKEIVVVDKTEFEKLSKETKENLFESF